VKLKPPATDDRTTKIFLDMGCREGDAIAAFLGDKTSPYYPWIRPRPDAAQYYFFGWESPTYKGNAETRRRFKDLEFELIEKLAWVDDRTQVMFRTDGTRPDARIVFDERTDPHAACMTDCPVHFGIPCHDVAAFILERLPPDSYIVAKMDIEGAEYQVLDRLIDTGALDCLDELYVEYHEWGQPGRREQIERAILQRVAAGELYYRNDWP
jgi:FkbM family methyltransferase